VIDHRIQLTSLRVLAAALVAFGFAVLAPTADARYAYTGNYDASTVSVIDTATNQVVGAPIPVGADPYSMAIGPDGRTLYVAGDTGKDITAIDTATNQPTATIPLGDRPGVIAIAPGGAYAYISIFGLDAIEVLDLQTNQMVGPPIPTGNEPWGVVFSPDGALAYVSQVAGNEVRVIDTASRQQVGAPIPVGEDPYTLVISPDGRSLYVANNDGDSVTVIDTATRQPLGEVKVGKDPWGMALSPDGLRLYVTNEDEHTVSVIDTVARQVVGLPIPVGSEPFEPALTPDGRSLYVPNYESDTVSVVDTTALQVTATIPVAGGPWQMAIVPDQSPIASFGVGKRIAGKPVAFDGAASSDPDGLIAAFDWSFGDGGTSTGAEPSVKHTYKKARTYSAALTVTDNEGCSAALVFTGRTAYCSGSTLATQTKNVKVVAPNDFKFRKLKRNPRRGIAVLKVKVPYAGRLTLFGKPVKRFKKATKRAGVVTLRIKPKPKWAKALRAKGRLKLRVKVTFKPQGGKARTKSRPLSLIQR
jgi:YVTN family beta-propeller protein